jgi:endonuclease/exonuclease/phosphatase family metal-dependent hydrolase
LYSYKMKLIFLNAWHGKVADGTVKFLKDQAGSTDVFCFQEADDGMREFAAGPLGDFQEVTAAKKVGDDHAFHLATYVKKNARVLHYETILQSDSGVGLGLYVQVPYGSGSAHIGNFHGISQPGDKSDNPNRLRQSREICHFFQDKNGLKIIGGDFNLDSRTQSIEMIEQKGYRNLVKEFNIATTRNHLAWEKYPDNKQYFCDYIFVSPEVKISSFSVPLLEISDHLPLIVELEV